MDARALFAGNVVPVLVEVRLIDAKLSDGARSHDISGWPAGGGLFTKSHLVATLRYVVAARGVFDLGKRLGLLM